MDDCEYSLRPATAADAGAALAAAQAAQSTADGAVSTNTTQDASIAANAAAAAANTSSITALTARLDNRDQKESVRALATTNNTLTGTQTVDGVVLVNGDRVGVIGQTLGQANGIYVVGTPWTRAADADTSAKVTSGMYFFVEEGTVAGKAYELTTPNPIVLGTTVLTFAHFAGALKASEITNDSSVSGTTSKDALNTLNTAVVANAASISAGSIGNASGQGGTQAQVAATSTADALNQIRKWTGEYAQTGGFAATANSATWTLLGAISTAQQLNTARVPDDTNWMTRKVRIGYVTSGTSGSVGFSRTTGAAFLLPRAGYMMVTRVGPSVLTTNMRWSCGVGPQITTNVDPNTQLNCVSIGSALGSGNLQLYYNDGSGTCTQVDLGSGFPITANSCYELLVIAAPGGGTFYTRVRRLDVANTPDVRTLTTNIPDVATFVGCFTYISNGADNAVCSIEQLDCKISLPF